MSTFAPDPVVLVALFAALCWAARGPAGHQPATLTAQAGRGARMSPAQRLPLHVLLAVAADTDAMRRPASATTSARVRRVVHEALGLLPPASAEYGSAVRIHPLRRLRSAVLLAVLVVILGVTVALSIGLVAFLSGFLLEQAIT